MRPCTFTICTANVYFGDDVTEAVHTGVHTERIRTQTRDEQTVEHNGDENQDQRKWKITLKHQQGRLCVVCVVRVDAGNVIEDDTKAYG